MAILDYSKQLNGTNVNGQIIISGLQTPSAAQSNAAGFRTTSTTVVGVVAGTLGFDVSSEYGNPLWSQAQQGLSEQLQGFLSVSSDVKRRLTGKGLSHPYTLLNANQSVKTWTGSSLPIFKIPLKFIALNEDDDVTDAHTALLSSVMPIFTSKNSLSAFMRPPLGYLPSGITASNTITVAIGQWFRATGQVMITVDMSYSKETLVSGSPLYCEGAISFTPFRIISYAEIQGYFL